LDGVNGHSPFTDFTKDAIRVAIEAIKRGTVKGGAEPDMPLMAREVVEPVVGVLGQPKPGKEAGRLLDGGFQTAAHSFEIHFSVSSVHEWKFTGQPFAQKIARDLAGLVCLGQSQTRDFQASRGGHE